MSSAKRDGWAIKGPDGVLRSSAFFLRRVWLVETLREREYDSLGKPGTTLAARIRNAKRLGYQLVPVRLVEVEGDDGE